MRGLLRIIRWEWHGKLNGQDFFICAIVVLMLACVNGSVVKGGEWRYSFLLPFLGLIWVFWSGYVWLRCEEPLERLAGIPPWQAVGGRLLCWAALFSALELVRQVSLYLGLPLSANLPGNWRELGLICRESAVGTLLGLRTGISVVVLGTALSEIYLTVLLSNRIHWMGNEAGRNSMGVWFGIYCALFLGISLCRIWSWGVCWATLAVLVALFPLCCWLLAKKLESETR